LFADDLKLYSVIEIDSTIGACNLQESINRISQWANLWQLSININKTTVITLSNSNTVCSRSYRVNDVELSRSNSVMDLGITIDAQLLFNNHIHNIVSKSSQRCGIVFRGFVCRNLSFLRKAFLTYVRPILEYNSIIWNPSSKKS
jgi:hypothetical protein